MKLTEVDVVAINMSTGQVLLDDGAIVPIAGYHNSEEEAEVPADQAEFVTFQFPNGKWGFALMTDFNSKMH